MEKQALTFITKSKGPFRKDERGFTLVELVIASVLSAVVFAAIFSAYIFMARNLTRLANFQQQQVQNRRVLNVVSKDVNEASQLNFPSNAVTLQLVLPTLPSSTLVTYTYDATAQTLTRQAVGSTNSTTVLLSNLTSFTFNYFDKSGTASPPFNFIKEIEMTYRSAVGVGTSGTQAGDSVVSSRMVLRSIPPVGQ